MNHDLLAAILAGAVASARHRAEAGGDRVRAMADARRSDPERFARALSAPGMRVIAECKRRSPSKGILRAEYDPVAVATGYAEAGAAAISVLTEPAFFDGALSHLEAVCHTVDLPVLRKDFVGDPFQIVEARAVGAAAVLLIVAALDAATLARLVRCASEEDVAALIEVHDAHELERALSAGATMVGVNSRNLKTLAVDLSLHERLVDAIPDDVIAVAESGLRTADDLRRLSDAGYDACLIGERFMSAEAPGRALAELLGGGGGV